MSFHQVIAVCLLGYSQSPTARVSSIDGRGNWSSNRLENALWSLGHAEEQPRSCLRLPLEWLYKAVDGLFCQSIKAAPQGVSSGPAST